MICFKVIIFCRKKLVRLKGNIMINILDFLVVERYNLERVYWKE